MPAPWTVLQMETEATTLIPPLWTGQDVAGYLGIPVRAFWQDVAADPAFPAPLATGPHKRRWRWEPETVRTWVTAQHTARRPERRPERVRRQIVERV